jgi:hypothetical protein
MVVSLSASVAMGAGAVPCYPIVPGDRLSVPANAPAFVAPVGFGDVGSLWVLEDGGVRELERLDGGARPYFFALFAPGAIARGQQLILESDRPTCTAAAPAPAAVSVIDAAPFPTELGTVSFGETSGFLNSSRRPLPPDGAPSVKRDVQVTFPTEVHPWLSVMRVTLNGSDTTYGHLARSVTSGSPTVVGSIMVECNQSSRKITQPVDVALEIPGYAGTVHAEATTELDCSLAPPAPGCSSVPVISLAALGLWLRRRALRARASEQSATAG